jgi:hypothetical protein
MKGSGQVSDPPHASLPLAATFRLMASAPEQTSPSAIDEAHLLPAPPVTGEATTTVEVGGQAIRLDALGPMIVNSDGVRAVGSSTRICAGQ